MASECSGTYEPKNRSRKGATCLGRSGKNYSPDAAARTQGSASCEMRHGHGHVPVATRIGIGIAFANEVALAYLHAESPIAEIT